MFPIRVKVCQESDLRMLGDLARNIQRVLPVTQADIDAAAALGKGWVVWKVIEVSDPLDNLRGGTQLIIKQNSVQPGQNVRRVIFVSGPGGETVVIGPAPSPLLLPDAIANSLSYVKAFGGTEQNGTPTPDAPVDIVSNNGVLKARHQSGLPLGYTQLTYIQSDGRQMINTGYVLQETDSVEVDYKLTDLTRTSDKFILGAQPVTGASNGGFWVETYDSNNDWYVRYGSSVSANTYGSVTPTSQLSGTLAISKNSFVVNGVEILKPNFVSMPVNPMTIFNRISLDGSIENNGASAQISEVRVKNGNNLVRRYIAVRNSNNELGMYDTVRGQFFTNDGTGDFVAGNPVSDPVEIYTDGTVETINAHGKNLFDRDTVGIAEGAIASSTGKNTSSSTRCRTVGYAPVKPNTTYTVSAVIDGYTGSSSSGIFVLEYTADSGDFESNYTGTSSGWKNPNGYTFTTGSTTHGIRFVFSYSTSGEISPSDITNIQLEEGSTATDYEPYYDGGTATAEMLLKVGDYQDEQEMLSGAVTRNIGVKVVDGTEDWQFVNTSYSDGTHRIYCNGLFFPAVNSFPDVPSGYCTNFPINSIFNRDVQNLGPCLMWSIQGSVHLRATQFTTLAAAKQWLADQYAAGTPVIIVYPIRTPTTESVAGQTLQVTQGDNVLEITQASIDGLELEAQYEQGVQASVQEIEP